VAIRAGHARVVVEFACQGVGDLLTSPRMTTMTELIERHADGIGYEEVFRAFAIELLEGLKSHTCYNGSDDYECAQMEVGHISVDDINQALEELRR
jgi:hypothetical protein